MKELLFNGCYKEWVIKKTKTTTIRAGCRDKSNKRGYKVGEKVLLRCLFSKKDEHQAMIEISSVEVKTIGELTYHDLVGESPDCLSKDAVKCVLGAIYKGQFNDNSTVTVIKFKYL